MICINGNRSLYLEFPTRKLIFKINSSLCSAIYFIYTNSVLLLVSDQSPPKCIAI